MFLDRQTFSENICLDDLTRQLTHLEVYDFTAPSQVLTRCQNAEIILTNKVELTAELLEQLPQLKLVCITATGINNIDIDAAKALNIAVTNVSGYAKQSVAQYVFAQLLNYFSQPNHHSDNVANGLWQHSASFCLHGNGSIELAGKTLGIVGYGSLGQAVATIAQAFGMQVLISERPNAKAIRAGRIAFEQLTQQVDILSLHCPQTLDTEQLINAAVLKKMKKSAVLINTARGALVNETDLLQALNQGEIAHAILDVISQEPPSADHPLLREQPSNLVITAHIAWASIEAQQRLINLVADNIAAFKQGKLVNRIA